MVEFSGRFLSWFHPGLLACDCQCSLLDPQIGADSWLRMWSPGLLRNFRILEKGQLSLLHTLLCYLCVCLSLVLPVCLFVACLPCMGAWGFVLLLRRCCWIPKGPTGEDATSLRETFKWQVFYAWLYVSACWTFQDSSISEQCIDVCLCVCVCACVCMCVCVCVCRRRSETVSGENSFSPVEDGELVESASWCDAAIF